MFAAVLLLACCSVLQASDTTLVVRERLDIVIDSINNLVGPGKRGGALGGTYWTTCEPQLRLSDSGEVTVYTFACTQSKTPGIVSERHSAFVRDLASLQSYTVSTRGALRFECADSNCVHRQSNYRDGSSSSGRWRSLGYWDVSMVGGDAERFGSLLRLLGEFLALAKAKFP
jgi:hypothetical protein